MRLTTATILEVVDQDGKLWRMMTPHFYDQETSLGMSELLHANLLLYEVCTSRHIYMRVAAIRTFRICFVSRIVQICTKAGRNSHLQCA